MMLYDFIPPPGPGALPIALSMSAASFLNQVSDSEAARIERNIERFSTNYDELVKTHVNRIRNFKSDDGHDLSVLRVSRDIRAFFYVNENVLHVVDILRRSQLESLKAIHGASK